MGEQIKEARRLRGLSQRDITALTDGEVSFAGLSRIESGNRYPTLRTLEALSKAMSATFRITPEGTELLMRL